MKIVYTLILVLLAGTAHGQSNLPDCAKTNIFSRFWNGYSDCIGDTTLPNGDKYVGEFKDGKRKGQGVYTLSNGSKYIGEFNDGKANGPGTFTDINGSKYTGEFKDGKFNGHGTFTDESRNRYIGEWREGKRQGQGTLTLADGRVFLGEWAMDKANGRLVKYTADGNIQESGIYRDNLLVTSQYIDPNIFTQIISSNTTPVLSESQRHAIEQSEIKIELEAKQVSNWITDKRTGCKTFNSNPEPEETVQITGSCVDGYLDGKGSVIWYKKSEYSGKEEGSFIKGKRSGQGTTTFKNGDKVVGEHKDNMLNGEATWTNSRGDKFVGKFINDKLDGLITATYSNGDKYVGEWKDGKQNGHGTMTYPNGDKFVGEWKDSKMHGQGYVTLASGNKYIGEFTDGTLNGKSIVYNANGTIKESGVFKDGKLVTSQYIDPNSFTRIARNNSAPAVSDSQRQAIEQRERQVAIETERLAEERRRLDAQKAQIEQEKKASHIAIKGSASQPDANGDFTITIQTGADTASLKINGEEQGGRPDGKYTLKRVARAGQETRFEIYAKDVYGNADTKTITVSRTVLESKVTYQQLNPDRIKRQPERDAVAIIIGISNYKSLPKADYSKDDAQVFFDYAIRALGVRPGNIKLLMDEQADAEEIYTAFKTWLPARVKSTTDVYVFYSGHGLPTHDGSGLYWLPQRANRDLLSKTAILLQEINSDIQASNPKSVTIFMDACYSGQARGGETLVASARPIALKSQPATFPINFTVISASQADQISSSSPELQHGIFSYYLMRGMEGEADLNKDGKITLDEIQKYLSENVGRQARIMNRQQEPQVIGDGNRVLVGK